jgi:PPK2 family polyphosphate:nucleotide phosphotransferase
MNITRADGEKRIRLATIDPADTGEFASKAEAKELLKAERDRIIASQQRLYAERAQSLLVVFQATDTGGKDGVVRNVFKGVNPQGCRVWGFGVPSEEELAHDALWRYHQRTPGKGMITVFNRSHYEEVIVVRVKNLVPKAVWKRRYDEINDFERLLVNNGTRILKFYLHISKHEQKERLQSRLDDPEKHWKFRIGDLDDRARWDDYQSAFQDAINQCSTPESPWFVVPANRKWYRDLVVAKTIADTLEAMNPQWPEEEEGLDKVVIPD